MIRLLTESTVVLSHVACILVTVKQEVCRKITLVNYDTDLPGLMATLQFSLQSSPGDPLVPLKKLSYRDSPKTQPLVSLDESTFNRELFLPMTKVCLLAVVEVRKRRILEQSWDRYRYE